MKRNISILGSTGSIGTQALEVVSRFSDTFNVVGLSANSNIELLKKQIEQFKPKIVAVASKEKADELKKQVNIEVVSGGDGLNKIATLQGAELVVNSIVGNAGLMPTIKAIEAKKNIALANKESLVCAGEIIMEMAKKHNSQIIPIDSEHSALFQSMKSGKQSEIKRLILTMGKGIIARMNKEQLENITMKDVLNRPAWDMGVKISIDSATCINKAFEVIEARWLFNLPAEKIDIVVHPEYLCHSLVEFHDGSIITELGSPDMRRYIQYALFYPERMPAANSFVDLIGKNISFEKPQHDKFPCLNFGHEAIRAGGTMPAVLHGADTSAAFAFKDGKIKFTQIPELIKKTMNAHKIIKNPALSHIFEAEKWAEEYAKKLLEEYK